MSICIFKISYLIISFTQRAQQYFFSKIYKNADHIYGGILYINLGGRILKHRKRMVLYLKLFQNRFPSMRFKRFLKHALQIELCKTGLNKNPTNPDFSLLTLNDYKLIQPVRGPKPETSFYCCTEFFSILLTLSYRF